MVQNDMPHLRFCMVLPFDLSAASSKFRGHATSYLHKLMQAPTKPCKTVRKCLSVTPEKGNCFCFFAGYMIKTLVASHQNKVCACRMHPNVYTGQSLILCKTERPAEYIYLIIYNISWKQKIG